MKISLKARRILLVITLLWVVGLLFVPMRKDVLTGYYTGTTPENQKFIPVNEVHVSALTSPGGFTGGPASIGGILFFALMPFFLVCESFNFKRPFSLTGKAFLQLQSVFLLLGGPYCYYMITYQQGDFYDAVHVTRLEWGGAVLVVTNVLLGGFLFFQVGKKKETPDGFFEQRK